MSVYLLPKTIIKKMDKTRRDFFWQGGGTKRKYHPVKWEVICKSYKKGGLGIKNLRKINISLLGKWWWKLENEDGLWQTIVKFKYIGNRDIHDIKHRHNDSAMWHDLVKIKDLYLQGRKVITNNGQLTRFWFDPWVYDQPLKDIAPSLFEICNQKSISVAYVLDENTVNFRRWLFEDLKMEWEKIIEDARSFQLNPSQDKIQWCLGKGGRYTVKSMYDSLTRSEKGLYQKKIWKGKIPAKIKIFLWLVHNDAVLTKENLRKRKWQGDPRCVFCNDIESSSHLFFTCPIAKIIWSIVAICIGANDIPNNLQQSWQWCEKWLTEGKKFHAWGIAAICWAIWK